MSYKLQKKELDELDEKLLKAYLVSRDIDFQKTHDLEFLLELCSRKDRDFKNLDIGNLNFYAAEVRYPDDFYIPTIKEANDCFVIAKNVKHFIFQKLNIHKKDLKVKNQ